MALPALAAVRARISATAHDRRRRDPVDRADLRGGRPARRRTSCSSLSIARRESRALTAGAVRRDPAADQLVPHRLVGAPGAAFPSAGAIGRRRRLAADARGRAAARAACTSPSTTSSWCAALGVPTARESLAARSRPAGDARRGPTRCCAAPASPRDAGSSDSRPARPTATRSAGRRERVAQVDRAALARARRRRACWSAPAATATPGVR